MSKSIVHSSWFRVLYIIIVLFFSVPLLVFAAQPLANKHSHAEAAQFKLFDLDGRMVSLSDFRGKPVVLLFWATWCPYCREELKVLNNMSKELNREGTGLLAIDVGEKPEIVRSFANRNSLSCTILLDQDTGTAHAYGVMGIPTYILIDREGGVILSSHRFPHEEYKNMISE